LLYLCGQSSIQVLDTSIEMVLQKKRWPAAQGQARGILRHTVYDASMRDDLIVLPTELSHTLTTHNAVIAIDGRNASTQNSDEYIAGHIPGAIQLPPTQVKSLSRYLHRTTSDRQIAIRPPPAQTDSGYFVIYAHSAMDSIALFTRLRANVVDPQVDIRVLPAGWQGWIEHQGYPISHSVAPQQSQMAREDEHNFQNSIQPIAAIAISGSAMLIIFIGLRKRGEKQWS
jgi:3-mercaptopyruvate sulfurtransferase SseA